MVIVVGLAGCTGSGKSACARAIASLRKSVVIDADALGHRVYGPGSEKVHSQLVHFFGPEIIDRSSGSVKRDILGQKVFADAAAMEKLTDIVWPAIRALAAAEIERHRSSSVFDIILLDAAVLVEAEWHRLVDFVLLFERPEPTTILARLKQRGVHLSIEEIEKRLTFVLPTQVASQRLESWQKPYALVPSSMSQDDTATKVVELIDSFARSTRTELLNSTDRAEARAVPVGSKNESVHLQL